MKQANKMYCTALPSDLINSKTEAQQGKAGQWLERPFPACSV